MAQGVLAAVAESILIDLRGMDDATVTAHVAGTFTAMNCTFEASMNSTNGVNGNWFPVEAVRTVGNAVPETTTGALSSAPAYAWEIPASGFYWVRIRCTAHSAGSQTWTYRLTKSFGEPLPIVRSHAVTLTSGAVTSTPATPTPTNTNSAASTNLTSVKAAAGTLYNAAVTNVSAGTKFVKLYNKASAPVLASDTPVLVIPVPASGAVSLNFGALGHRFALGIAMSITGAAADTDATAVALGDVKVALSYI